MDFLWGVKKKKKTITIIQTFLDSDHCGLFGVAAVLITLFTPVQALIFLFKRRDHQGSVVRNTPFGMEVMTMW